MSVVKSRLLVGTAGSVLGAKVLRYGGSFTDDGVPVLIFAKTAEVIPSGVGGRSVFHRLWIAVTFTVPFLLRLTPILDGKVAADEYADIRITDLDFDDPDQDLVEGQRATHLFEIALSLPYIRDSVERFRTAMQGNRFQLQISQPGSLPDEGDMIIESLELEYEVITKGSVQ